MTRFLFSLITVALLLALSCARQTTPTGGPKDTIPPQLLQSIPPNRTINFNTNTITLLFDEYIQLDNQREQLLITPNISSDSVQLTAQKKKVILHIKQKLSENTTYTYNFREAIKDITEKNPAQDLVIAVSTGSYLDSLELTGNSYLALTNKPIENATIALTSYSDTFNIFQHRPTYITRADKQGNFRFQNLKPDKYILYAFADKNKNLTIDTRSESYGYFIQPVTISADTTYEVSIPQFRLDNRDLKIISARPYNTYYNLRLTKSYHKIQIQTDPSDSLAYQSSDDNTSLKFYTTKSHTDSAQVHLLLSDSTLNKIDTLVYAKFNTIPSKPEQFQVTKKITTLTKQPSTLKIQLQANKPIRTITYDSIGIFLDSASFTTMDPSKTVQDTLHNIITFYTSLTLPTPPTESTTNRKPTDQKFRLYIAKASIISIENDSSSTIDQPITLLTSENTGTILIDISNNTSHPHITQLLDGQGQYIDQIINQQHNTFRYVPPGNYQIRVITDTSQNDSWDPGLYKLHVEPEPINFYINDDGKTTVLVKPNWEIGPLLITVP